MTIEPNRPGDGAAAPPPPRVACDASTGRPILLAPQRRHRPYLFGERARGVSCPFCEGEESRTPPEVDALRPRGGAADGPGWTVRAVPNLYPASPQHEVVIEGAAHTVHPAALDAALLPQAIALYQRRIAAIEANSGVACAYLFKNVGRRAGASIAHNHSQVLGLPMIPPRLQLELEQGRAHSRCPHCAEIETAAADGRIVARSDHHIVLCPRAPKFPYETWLLPLAHDDDFVADDDALRADRARALAAMFTALRRNFDDPPFNMFLHRIPKTDFHWHWELVLRTGNLAGLELGGDMYINAVEGAEAAARLRGSRP